MLASLFLAGAGLCADDWDVSMKKARKEDKPVVLYFYSAYCPYCIAMDKDVLADKEISGSLKNNTIYLRVDVDKREDLATLYSIRGYPTTTFLQPGGQNIAKIPGYIAKKDFKKLLAFVTGKYYRSMTLKDFLRKQPSKEISQR